MAKNPPLSKALKNASWSARRKKNGTGIFLRQFQGTKIRFNYNYVGSALRCHFGPARFCQFFDEFGAGFLGWHGMKTPGPGVPTRPGRDPGGDFSQFWGQVREGPRQGPENPDFWTPKKSPFFPDFGVRPRNPEKMRFFGGWPIFPIFCKICKKSKKSQKSEKSKKSRDPGDFIAGVEGFFGQSCPTHDTREGKRGRVAHPRIDRASLSML